MPLPTDSGSPTRATLGSRPALFRLAATMAATTAIGVLLGGCQASGEARFEIAPGSYERAFDASRQTLREFQFQLERVDSAEGVITTAPRASAGIATPWHAEQSTLSQEFDDLLNQHERSVRIEFAPVPADNAAASTGVVRATVFRLQAPGLRPASRAIGSTTTTTDPALIDRGIWAGQLVPAGEDPKLAARLAKRIEAILAEGPRVEQPAKVSDAAPAGGPTSQ